MKMKTLAQVNPKADISFDPQDAALNRPEVLSLIARCISTWSLVETLVGQVVCYALKGDIRAAAEMYLSITSTGASVAALKTAVRMGLSREYAELFNAIWTIGGDLAEERHRLAHWCLGYSKDIPNALLLLNPREGIKRGAHNISVGRLRQYGQFSPRPINKIRVLSIEYLDFLIEQFDLHVSRVHGFLQLLSLQEGNEPPDDLAVKRQCDLLCNEPQIHQTIALARASQKNSKAVPKQQHRSKPRGQKRG